MKNKPFVKWAGGKGQLLVDIQNKYPHELGKSIVKYCEPFVGGGAVLFDILSTNLMQEILINDINIELMNAYSYIKFHVDNLLNELELLQKSFWSMDTEKRKELYYIKRERFNFLKISTSQKANLEKAVLFIFLNKTCFNGLFRVNKQGEFNVPIGAYKKPVICDINNLQNISKLLQAVEIRCGNYEDCLSFVDKSTFVYIDPPYRPLTTTSSFTAYSEKPFDDAEQIALGKFVDEIHELGAKVVISNSDPKNNDEFDEFFDDLYKPYIIQRVSARRMINSNSTKRGEITELLISNY